MAGRGHYPLINLAHSRSIRERHPSLPCQFTARETPAGEAGRRADGCPIACRTPAGLLLRTSTGCRVLGRSFHLRSTLDALQICLMHPEVLSAVELIAQLASKKE